MARWERVGIKSLAQHMKALRARGYRTRVEFIRFPRTKAGHGKAENSETETTMTYWRLHYHLIWGTLDREPSLTLEREKIFYGVIYGKGEELGLKIHSAGNIEDHVHIVISIPPKIAIADCVRHLKGASAFAINHMAGSDSKFKWQSGYGAISVDEHSLEKVMEYAARQKEHHKERATIDIYERMGEEE